MNTPKLKFCNVTLVPSLYSLKGENRSVPHITSPSHNLIYCFTRSSANTDLLSSTSPGTLGQISLIIMKSSRLITPLQGPPCPTINTFDRCNPICTWVFLLNRQSFIFPVKDCQHRSWAASLTILPSTSCHKLYYVSGYTGAAAFLHTEFMIISLKLL